MVYGVPEPCHGEQHDQCPKRSCDSRQRYRNALARQARDQKPSCAQSVDQEPDRGLAHTAGDAESRENQPQARVTNAQFYAK